MCILFLHVACQLLCIECVDVVAVLCHFALGVVHEDHERLAEEFGSTLSVLKMRAADGSVQSYDITLDGQDHAYTLTIDTDNTTGGVITLSPEGKPRQTLIIYPIYYEDLSGASLMNNTLSYEGNACSVIAAFDPVGLYAGYNLGIGCYLVYDLP